MQKLFQVVFKTNALKIQILGLPISLKYSKFLVKFLCKIKDKRKRRILRCNGKIRVGFLVTEASKWGYQSLYDLFEKSKEYEPVVLVTKTPSEHKNRTKYHQTMQDCLAFFETRKMKTEIAYDEVQGRYRPLSDFKVGIVFYQQPWDVCSLHHPYFVSKQALTFYSPYGLELTEKSQGYMESFHRWLDMVFLTSKKDKEATLKFADDITNCEVVGYPKLDDYQKIVPEKHSKPVVIYAPHHSFEKDGIRLATFQWSGEAMKKLAETFQKEVVWVFKPHPRLKYALIKNKIMSENEVENYYKFWSEIGSLYDTGDYLRVFVNSDALITDCASFLGEYLPTEKPVLHLISPDAKYNVFGKALIKGFYKIHTSKELSETFRRVVLEKNDYQKELRLRSLEYVYDPKVNAASKIYQIITQKINQEGN